MSLDRPNLLLISCDELRFDALGCTGNPIVKTPNIDRLASEGVLLEHFFVQSPVCQPSRATIATGRYPHIHGVKWNWYDLPVSEVTVQSLLTQAGYATTAVGKMHFEPTTELHGFQRRVFVEGKLFAGDDEYRLFLARIGKRSLYGDHVQRWNDNADFGARVSPLPDGEYIDTFIGEHATDALKHASSPFFSWVSFVNPHFPFDPPEPFSSMYDPRSIPLPPDFRFRQAPRIPEQRVASAGRSFHQLSEDLVKRIRAYYYGTISLVDREVGRILDALTGANLLERTVVIFMSDHGDLLGNRGMLWKGRMLYDHLIRVPFIVRYPREIPAGKIVSELCQATDITPTLLDFAGIPLPPGVQGLSLRPLLQQKPTRWRQAVFSEVLDTKMVRDFKWKLIFYPGRSYGELYALETDPLELDNLYDRPEFEGRKARLMEQLATILAESEDPLPLPKPRPGYFEFSGVHTPYELGGDASISEED